MGRSAVGRSRARSKRLGLRGSSARCAAMNARYETKNEQTPTLLLLTLCKQNANDLFGSFVLKDFLQLLLEVIRINGINPG